MAAEDYLYFDFDPLDYYDGDFGREIQCKYCKNLGFYWGETEAGWRLFTKTGKLHKCKAHPVNKIQK